MRFGALLLFLTTTLQAMPASIARINGSVTIDGNLDDEAMRATDHLELALTTSREWLDDRIQRRLEHLRQSRLRFAALTSQIVTRGA